MDGYERFESKNRKLIGSLSKRIFETRTATGRGHVACQDGGVSLIFILIVSNGEKILWNVNVIVSRQDKREISSLPVAFRVSKTRVLKLPNSSLLRAYVVDKIWRFDVVALRSTAKNARRFVPHVQHDYVFPFLTNDISWFEELSLRQPSPLLKPPYCHRTSYV